MILELFSDWQSVHDLAFIDIILSIPFRRHDGTWGIIVRRIGRGKNRKEGSAAQQQEKEEGAKQRNVNRQKNKFTAKLNFRLGQHCLNTNKSKIWWVQLIETQRKK